ncbi:BTB/POZ [Penicillium occitanis (nom. inval.)]|nr:hypothetical protein PENOC_035540 [Penicillium occitanis (nom. inval.)]PCH05006.1 BTB/POZ [Penicillium occitanis (nom. inval.)]
MDVDNDDSYSETSESLASVPGETVAIGDLPATLEWIYDTGEFSDFTVILGEKRVKLHKSVVCGQSPVFRKAVLDGKDEIVPDTWSFEKNTEVSGAVFRFMYGLKYDNLIVSSCMRFHAEVFQLAVCLGVSELRNFAKQKFKKCIKTAWDADEFLKVLVMAKFLFPEYCMSIPTVMSTETDISALSTGMKRTYKWDNLSDITILVNGEEFKLHKVVIWEHSLQLKTLCEGKDKIEIEPLKILDYVQRSYETMFQFMYGH